MPNPTVDQTEASRIRDEQSPSLPNVRPENPFKARLESQGIDFSIPQRSKDFIDLQGGDVTIDDVTEMPLEDAKTRTAIVSGITKCIRDDIPFAIIYSDLDNLKSANNIDRKLGDMYIKYGIARVNQALEAAGLRSEVDIISARASGAADEAITVVLGLDNNELNRITEELQRAEDPVHLTDPEFSFSVSAPIMSSFDPETAQEIAQTKQWLTEDDTRSAYDFYEGIKNKADTMAKTMKIAKDMARMPIAELMTTDGVDQLIDILEERLGDSRISKPLLRASLKFAAIRGALSANVSADTKEKMWRDLGITPESLQSLESEEQREALFTNMFRKLST